MIFVRRCKICKTKIECATIFSMSNTRYCSKCKKERAVINRKNYYIRARDVLKIRRRERYQKQKVLLKEIRLNGKNRSL